MWGLSEGIAAGCGPIVKVWAPAEPRQAIKINEGTPVYCLAISHNNKVLAMAGEKGHAVLYASGKGEPPSSVGTAPVMPSDAVDSITCLTFAAKASHLIGGCANGTVHVWSLRGDDPKAQTNYALKPLHGSVTSVAGNPASTMLASASTSGQVVLSRYPDGEKMRTLLKSGPRTGCLGFTAADESLLCGAKGSGQLLVWDVSHASDRPAEFNVHRANVTGCTFAPNDANLLVSCGQDGLLACTDRRVRQVVWEADVGQPLFAVSMRWDGSQVAVGTGSGRVLLHDTRRVSTAVAAQQFSDELPVTALCWQHKPHSKSHNKSSSGAAAAAATNPEASSAAASSSSQAGAAPGSVASTAAASGRRVPAAAGAAAVAAAAGAPARSAAGGSARRSGAPAAAAAPLPPQKTPLVVPGWDTTTPKSLGVTPTVSSSSDADYHGLRVVSPMRLYNSPLDSDLASGLLGAAGAAAGGGGLHTPAEVGSAAQHTPADSSVSAAGYRGPAMFTPGLGQLGAMGGSAAPTPFGGPTADVTPVSRLAAPAAPPAAAAAAPRQVQEPHRAAATSQAAAPGPNSSKASDAGGSQRGRVSDNGVPSGRSAAAAKQPGAAAGATSAAGAPALLSKGSRTSAGGGAGAAAGSTGGAAGGTSSTRRKASDSSAAPAVSAAAVTGSTKGRPSAGQDSSSSSVVAADAAAAAAADGSVVVVATSGSAAATTSGKVAAVEGVGGPAGASQQRISSSSQAPAGSLGVVPVSSQAAGGGVLGGVAAGSVLREDVFKAYIDARINGLQESVTNMHMNMQQQFAQAQADLAVAMTSLAARQDQLAEAVTQLTEAVQSLSLSKQQQRQPQASVSMIPWI